MSLWQLRAGVLEDSDKIGRGCFHALESTGRFLCGLTFELSGRQRQDARPGPVKMYRVPPARAWWPAVGAPLERGVRRQARQQMHSPPSCGMVGIDK